ncbi:2'-5' RNA ligase family protein [Sphingomonas quercus]|uniref:2'-5' RNA ligase family protein n=1 Tax=Sphingomonas quercus TaxID=2842451 RepID=A0ABS6BM47_9SPHN|nr:2'-5' RNA ligase family protein [Sphingomonas quercus]MBU3078912.1 2'-5' RNA ligase family protein [Sphingomonas quercus]
MRGPIILTALFSAADHALLDGLRRAHYPPGRDRVPAHLTLFHHLPPSLEDALSGQVRRMAAGPPPAAILAGTINLGGGTALRVRSPGLETIRAELADAFAGMLIPQDRAAWRPHVTIQNKVPAAEARALQHALAGRFENRPLAIAGLGAWEYRGGPWAPLGRWAFRG